MSAKFYHYASAQFEREIVEDEFLKPSKRLVNLRISGLPDRAYDGALFGLPDDPLPLGWCSEQWGNHGGDLGMSILESVFFYKSSAEFIRLEIEPTDEDDQLFVTDYGVHQVEEYKGSEFTDDPATLRTKWQYYNRLVPWAEYQDRKEELNYLCPEVISFAPIPLTRLTGVERVSNRELRQKIREKGGLKPDPRLEEKSKKTLDLSFLFK